MSDKLDTAGEDERLTPEVGALIKTMWDHVQTQAVFERKSEYQLNDSSEYYFKQVDTLSAPTYIPTEQDVLRSRVRTTGIVQTDFKIKGLDFAMFDVGGQRNERRKWIHAFDDVNAVIFVAALSEFDQASSRTLASLHAHARGQMPQRDGSRSSLLLMIPSSLRARRRCCTRTRHKTGWRRPSACSSRSSTRAGSPRRR
jgi:hypothetical protein